jgi:hypothetical protein
MPMPSGVVHMLLNAEKQLNDTIQQAVDATGNPNIEAVTPDPYFTNGWLCTASGQENIANPLFNGLELDGGVVFNNTNDPPLYDPWNFDIVKTWAGTDGVPTDIAGKIQSMINPIGLHPNPNGHAQMAKAVIASLP